MIRRSREFLASIGPAGVLPLFVLFGLNMVDEFDQVAFGALAPEIRNHFNLSNASFILVVSLSGALSILAAAPLGYLADRYNRVRLSQIAGLIWALAALATGLAPVIGVLIAARFVGGIGRLVNEPVHPSLLADYYPPETLPNVFGVHRFANILGNIAGPVAGIIALAFVASPIDEWRPVFVIMAIPTFVLLGLSLRLKEPARGGTIDADAAERPAELFRFGEAFRRLRAIHSLRRTWVSAFFFGAGVIPLASFMSLFFEDIYGMGPVGRGSMVMLRGAGGAVGLVLGAALTRRYQRDRLDFLPIVTSWMVISFAVGLVGMALAPWLLGSVLFAFLLSIGASGFLPPYLTTVALIAPPKIRSQSYAYSLLFFALGGVFLSRIAAGVGDLHGLRAGTLLLSVFVGLGGAVALTTRRFIARDVAEAEKSIKAQEAAESGTFLVTRGLDVAYDQVQVLFGVDFEIEEGEIVALLGTNGAGKSTLLKAISGLVDPVGGAIYFEGRDITHADANSKAAAGIVQVPGGRGVFPSMTVGDNIRAAGWMFRGEADYREDAVKRVLDYFPILRTRWDTPAGSLSGGEQQMLSLAQAFIAKPRLLLIDELSLGLAPTVVESLLEIVREIHRRGTTVVLVEQSVNTALKLAKRAAFMEKGEVRFEGPTAELLNRPDILRAVFLKGGASTAPKAKTPAGRGTSERARKARRDELKARPVVLQTTGLSKSYGGVLAVDDVDIELHDGEILGLIGPNGAGKTTLFDLISGFTPTNGGRLSFMGVDITERSATQRAAMGLGRSFQDARLWQALTIREAIAVAAERHIEVKTPLAAIFNTPIERESEADIARETEELIELLSLQAFRDKFISELSTGSRRIVEIAAILAHRPSVILLDEPSSGIAQRETEALGPLLRQVRDHLNCSMLVIEHDMPLITNLADRMYGLEQGRVICEGTPNEVINHPAVIESYLGQERYGELSVNGRTRSRASKRGSGTRSGTSRRRRTASRS